MLKLLELHSRRHWGNKYQGSTIQVNGYVWYVSHLGYPTIYRIVSSRSSVPWRGLSKTLANRVLFRRRVADVAPRAWYDQQEGAVKRTSKGGAGGRTSEGGPQRGSKRQTRKRTKRCSQERERITGRAERIGEKGPLRREGFTREQGKRSGSWTRKWRTRRSHRF